MPKILTLPEKLIIRLPAGTRARIEALKRDGEGLATTQRRVVLAGIESEQNAVQEPAATVASEKEG